MKSGARSIGLWCAATLTASLLAWWLLFFLPAFDPCRVLYRVHNAIQDTLLCQVHSTLGLFAVITSVVGIVLAMVAGWKVSRFFRGTLIATGIILLLFLVSTFFAGARLELENQTGQDIKNIQVDYKVGSLHVAQLIDKEVFKKPLGKIGESVTFDVEWEEESGLKRKVRLGVYFSGFTGYDTVRIRPLPGGESELLYKW